MMFRFVVHDMSTHVTLFGSVLLVCVGVFAVVRMAAARDRRFSLDAACSSLMFGSL